MPPDDPIQTLLDREDWPAARRLVLRDLRKTPDSHWLLARLNLESHLRHRRPGIPCIYPKRYARRLLSLLPPPP